MSLTRHPRRALSSTGFSFTMPTNHDEATHTHKMHGAHSWQAKTLAVLHTRWVQYTLMALLLLDVLILFVDLFLIASYPNCSIISRDAISCCPFGANADGHQGRLLSAGSENSICEAPLEVTGYEAGCNSHKYPAVHDTEVVLFALTMFILGVFFVHLAVEMVVLTPCVFFRNFVYVFDLVIVCTSIALEIVFVVFEEEALSSLLGLLILGRVWRFVRISHGLVEVTSEITSHRYKELLAYTAELEKICRDHDIVLPEQMSSIHTLPPVMEGAAE